MSVSIFFETNFRVGSAVTVIKIRIPVISEYRILLVDEIPHVIIRHPQSVTLPEPGRHNVRTVLRIQIPYLLDWNIHQLGNLFEMQGIRNHDRVTHRRQLVFQRVYIMFLVIIKSVHRRDKSRHVPTGFFRQVEINIPVILLASGTADGFIHVPRSAIVRGNHQNPVLVYLVQILQKTNCSLGRLHRITALVKKRINFQLVHFSRPIHKLPKPASSRPGKSSRVQGTFNHGQVFQLVRQTFPV